jgi:hypothetical protein
MSNADQPNGAVAYKHLTGGIIRENEYPIADAYATSIYSGDWVKLGTDGTIQRAAAGDTVLGVFKGVWYQDTTGKNFFRQYWPASTATATGSKIRAVVMDDPNVLWVMQHNGTPSGQTDVGQLYDIVATAGSTLTGQSKEEIDTSTAATSSKVFQQVGYLDTPDNDSSGANAKGIFRVVLHAFNSTSGV